MSLVITEVTFWPPFPMVSLKRNGSPALDVLEKFFCRLNPSRGSSVGVVQDFPAARVRELVPDFDCLRPSVSLVRLLVLVRPHSKPIPPLINAAGRNGYRIFSTD